MTDNRTTELLPCPMCRAAWPSVQVRWIGFTHTHNGAFSAGYRGECCDCGLTTRAFNNEAEAIAAWNTRATHGTLTAEQVRKAIFRCGVFDEDYAMCCVSRTDMQAIADELNAELGSGTCEPNWVLQGKTQTQEFWRCECGNCGHEFGVETRESFPLKMTIGKVEVPNYCPNCGAKAVSA